MSCCNENYNTYPLRSEVAVRSNTFRNRTTGNPIDPTAVFVEVTNPAGTKQTYEYGEDPEVVRTGVGVYELVVDASLTGFWHYTFYSTGTGKAANTGRFYVS